MNRNQTTIIGLVLLMVSLGAPASDRWHDSDLKVQLRAAQSKARAIAEDRAKTVEDFAEAILGIFFDYNTDLKDYALSLAQSIRNGGEEAGEAYADLMKRIGENRRIELQGKLEDPNQALPFGFKSGDAARFLWAIDGADSIPNGNQNFEPPPIMEGGNVVDSEEILAGFYRHFDVKQAPTDLESRSLIEDYSLKNNLKMSEIILKPSASYKSMFETQRNYYKFKKSNLLPKYYREIIKSNPILIKRKDMFEFKRKLELQEKPSYHQTIKQMGLGERIDLLPTYQELEQKLRQMKK